MDVAIQTDHVDPQEILNILIQQDREQGNHDGRRHHSGEETSLGLMKHYQPQQDPDAIHRLTDEGDIPGSEVEQKLQRNPSHTSKVRSKQQPSKISFARGSKKCPSETKQSSSGNNNSNSRGKHSSEQSLSDRICQVVWSRKESAPFVTPLASKRMAHLSSARRGTAPNVPVLRHNFEPKPDAFGGRSQSFKGSSSSGSVRKRIAAERDPLSRRASGDTVPAAEYSSVAHRALHPLKPKGKSSRRFVGDCDCSSGETGIENETDYHHKKACRIMFGQNFESNSLNSSAAGSGQNLSSPALTPADPLDRKMGGLHVHRSSCKSHSSHDGEGDRVMRRQVSMTLSIPSRENSVRSCSSSKSYGSYSATPGPASSSPIFPCSSRSITNAFAATSNVAGGQMKPSMGKLVRCGSNPDVFPSRQANWKHGEHETLHQHFSRSKNRLASPCRSLVGSSNNIEAIFPGGGMYMSSSSTNLEEKKKQILSQKKRNEKVAWAVHLGFSSLLILAITCIVVFLRISSTMTSQTPSAPSSSSYYPGSSVSISSNDFSNFTNASSSIFDDVDDYNITSDSVRKENENLLQSIQPQLNLHNITTPQPSTHTQQVYDNSNGNEDSGQSNDKSIPSLQSGQSLIRTKDELILSSSSSDSSRGEDEDEQQKSNNETTHENLNIMSATGRREMEGGDSIDRSNNIDSSKVANNSSSSNNNPSLKSNSIRPKRNERSRSRPKTEESGGDLPSKRNSNIIISVLNEKVHTNVINDTPSGLKKARHLESTFIRYLKNSGSGMRERRNLDMESRKL